MSDLINNPEHYNAGSIECIEAIEASMTPEEFKGSYLKGKRHASTYGAIKTKTTPPKI